MLFKPEMIEAILAGKKTQTRRVVKDGEFFAKSSVPGSAFVYTYLSNDKSRTKWALGRTYAIVPKRGAKGIGRRIRITAIRREWLHDISEADAIAEGVGSVAEYKALWDAINAAGSWLMAGYVWVLSFELVEGGEAQRN